MDGFDSAWLKWAQAVVNADVLQDNINELHNAGQVQIQMGMTQEYDARRHCVIITAGPEVPRVFPVHWGCYSETSFTTTDAVSTTSLGRCTSEDVLRT
jgi:hypothetical protein